MGRSACTSQGPDARGRGRARTLRTLASHPFLQHSLTSLGGEDLQGLEMLFIGTLPQSWQELACGQFMHTMHLLPSARLSTVVAEVARGERIACRPVAGKAAYAVAGGYVGAENPGGRAPSRMQARWGGYQRGPWTARDGDRIILVLAQVTESSHARGDHAPASTPHSRWDGVPSTQCRCFVCGTGYAACVGVS
jgi:hypothetical protein